MATQPNGASAEERRRLSDIFFLAAFLFVCWLMMSVLAPFLALLGAAALLVILAQPLHARILRRVKGRRTLAAILSTFAIVLAVLVPLSAGIWFLVVRAIDVAPQVQHWVQELLDFENGTLTVNLPATLRPVMQRIQELMAAWDIDLSTLLGEALKNLGPELASFAGAVLKSIPVLLFNMIVVLFATFFFFRDGALMYDWVLRLLPMDREHAEAIFGRLDATLVAIVRGSFLTAFAQGVAAGIGFVIAGAPFALLLGCAATVLAFIPIVGTMAVWLPTGIWLITSGRPVAGVFVLVWGALIVGLMDNLLRPYLVGTRANLPIFLMFFATLGGLRVYGPTGLLFGPCILAAFLGFAAVFLERWRAPMPHPETKGGTPTPKEEERPAVVPAHSSDQVKE